MSFSVRPDELDGFAGLCDRASVDAKAIAAYLATKSEFPRGSQGWLALFGNMHAMLIAEMRQRVEDVDDAMRGSGAELRRAATYYRQTDQAAATQTDSSYYPVRR